ncbi:MAG: sensor domain-containing diguanylate cyclase [Candidatus Obscuribacterales bacterium]|nr:sensor domain-containing diguanylate cyclase [Candidatus Obscuribacterales bacterium]
MTDSTSARLMSFLRSLNSSLRLKDVLEIVVQQLFDLTGGAKVAVFLSDNDSLSLKLVSAKGYSEASLDQLHILNFSSETIFKQVIQTRKPALVADSGRALDLSAAVMKREGSKGQVGLPLIASNLLVGAVLLDLPDAALLNQIDLLQNLASLCAQAIANAILFGRSEYERERLGTLYKTSLSLSGSSLKVSEVLQIAADTALILANTAHCAVLIVDKEKGAFNLAAFKGLDGNSLSDFDLAIEGSAGGRALAVGKAEYVSDAASIQLVMPRSTGGGVFGSTVAVPILHGHKPVGVIQLFSADTWAFHAEQIELLESLAQQVGVALNIAFTHENAASQSVQDAHTGLFNHWHFNETVVRELERSTRHKHEFALLRVDIDHLSRVNELLGAEKGDAAIKHVAVIIKNCLRDIDIPCRYGSQEFVIILPETQRQSALDVAERVRAKVKKETVPGVGMVTVSVGLSTYPANGENPGSLLKAAEQALDVAKFEGRDRIKAASTNSGADQVSWEELARQAKLSILEERQSKLHSRLAVPAEYAPWMRAVPSWTANKKKSD